MHKAGYDINEAPNFWKNMKAASSKTPIEFLSTHPSNDNRIKEISKTIKEIEKQ